MRQIGNWNDLFRHQILTLADTVGCFPPVSASKWLNVWIPEATFLPPAQKKEDPLCTVFREKYPERRIHNNVLERLTLQGEWIPDLRGRKKENVPGTSATGEPGSPRNPTKQRIVPDTCPAPTQAQMALNVDFGQFLSPIDENTCAAPPARQPSIDIFFADNPQLVQPLPPYIAQDDGNQPAGDPFDELGRIFGR